MSEPEGADEKREPEDERAELFEPKLFGDEPLDDEGEGPAGDYGVRAPGARPEEAGRDKPSRPAFEPIEPRPTRFQFSLWEMLVLLTLAGVYLSVFRLLPGQWGAELFAGITGLAVLLGLIVLALVQPDRDAVRLGWWVLLGIYLLTALVAALRL